jgi:hypothetical protein
LSAPGLAVQLITHGSRRRPRRSKEHEARALSRVSSQKEDDKDRIRPRWRWPRQRHALSPLLSCPIVRVLHPRRAGGQRADSFFRCVRPFSFLANIHRRQTGNISTSYNGMEDQGLRAGDRLPPKCFIYFAHVHRRSRDDLVISVYIYIYM